MRQAARYRKSTNIYERLNGMGFKRLNQFFDRASRVADGEERRQTECLRIGVYVS